MGIIKALTFHICVLVITAWAQDLESDLLPCDFCDDVIVSTSDQEILDLFKDKSNPDCSQSTLGDRGIVPDEKNQCQYLPPVKLKDGTMHYPITKCAKVRSKLIINVLKLSEVEWDTVEVEVVTRLCMEYAWIYWRPGCALFNNPLDLAWPSHPSVNNLNATGSLLHRVWLEKWESTEVCFSDSGRVSRSLVITLCIFIPAGIIIVVLVVLMKKKKAKDDGDEQGADKYEVHPQ